MPVTIGIDLGTTNTAVSYMENGRPVMLQNEKGYTVFPSIVFWDKTGSVIVGRRARSKMLTDPDRGVYSAKRLMGLRCDATKVAEIQARVPYKIVPSADGMCLIDIAGEKRSPVDIAGLILLEAKKIAEHALEQEVTGAVITVPAHFNHAQRDMTKKAAEKIGLRCELIINEPTAAALGYGFRQDVEKKVLVYDLGGGTFDVSLLQFDVGVVETLATRGDTFLGGEDFDIRVVNYIAEHFLAQSGVDLREDPIASLRLKDAAEAAKCELSFKEKTKIYIPQIHQGESIELEYHRSQLEEATEDLIQKTLDVVRQTLEDKKIRISQVDEVLLVGGQSRMPRIQQSITNLFNKKPSRGVNPDEAVAIGAAVRAGSMDDPSKGGPILLDVTPFDLGIDISGGLFEKVILRNSKVPTAVTKTFSAVRYNQKVIRIVVRQGESRIAKENEFLGEFRMTNLATGSRGTISVDVTFEIDSNGMLKVRAIEPETREEADIIVRNYGEFTQGSGVSLSVEERSHEGVRSPEILDVVENKEDHPQSNNEKIQKKAGFFGKLFGSKKKKEARLDLEETVEDYLEEEVMPVAELSFEEQSEEELLLEDIFEESPAQQGLANSSFAVSGQEREETKIGLVEGGEEEFDVSEYLVDGTSEELSIAEVELEELLVELDEDSEEELGEEGLEGALDDLLSDLDATVMMERPTKTTPVFPEEAREEAELDLGFLDKIEDLEESISIEIQAEHTEDEPVVLENTDDVEEELELDLDFLEEDALDDVVNEVSETPEIEEVSSLVEVEEELELDLDFLEEDALDDVVKEVSETPEIEEVEEELELNLDFLEEDALDDVVNEVSETPEIEEVSSLVEVEEELELDLDFLEHTEDEPGVLESTDDVEEELELDLDFLSEEPQREEEQEKREEELIDLSLLSQEPQMIEESSVSTSSDKEGLRLVLQSHSEEIQPTLRNEVIGSFLKENTKSAAIFEIQEDGFFVEETIQEEIRADEAIEIPTETQKNDEPEEELDLDFFEDLFDD
jgi:molecular chaperone DnaK